MRTGSRIPGFSLNSGQPMAIGPAELMWDPIDVNAEHLKIEMPAGSATQVPVFNVGVAINDVDLGLYDGETFPTVVTTDLDFDSGWGIGWVADDRPAVKFYGSAGALEVIRAGNPLVVQNTTVQADNQAFIIRGPDQAGAEAIGDELYLSFEQDTADGIIETVRLTSEILSPATSTVDARFKIGVLSNNALITMFQIDSSVAGVLTTTIPAGDIILNDGVSIRFGTAGAQSDLESNGTNTVWDFLLGTFIIDFASSTDVIFSANLVDLVDGTILEVNELIQFNTTGAAVTGASYEFGRDDADVMHSNVPTGATFEWSVNDIAEMILSATAVNFQDNSITTTGGGSLTGTWTDLGSVTTVDINGGTIDGSIIGGAVAAAGTFTAIVGTGLTITSEMIQTAGVWAFQRDYTISTIAGVTALTIAPGVNAANTGNALILQTNSNVDAQTTRLTVTGGVATAAVTWAAVTIDYGSVVQTNLNIDSGDVSAITVSGGLTWSAAQNLNSQALTNVNIDSGDLSAITISGGLTWSAAQNFSTGTTTIATANINGGTVDSLTSLSIRSTGAAFDLTFATATVFTAGRTLTFDPGDADRTITLTGNPTLVAGTMATTGGTLAQFAATTSAELAGVISDETGSGLLVFGTSPTIGTPIINTPNIDDGTVDSLTSLSIRSTGAAFDLTFATATVFTAGRVLTIDPGDSARTLTLSGNPTISDWFDQDVKTTANPTFVNLTITSFAADWTNAGRTVVDAGILSTVDINGGSIDGTAIGAAATSTIRGSTIDALTDFTIGATIITDGVLTDAGGFQMAAVLDMANNAIDSIGASGNDFGASQLDLAASFNIVGANLLKVSTTLGTLELKPLGNPVVLINGTVTAVSGGLNAVAIGGNPGITLVDSASARYTQLYIGGGSSDSVTFQGTTQVTGHMYQVCISGQSLQQSGGAVVIDNWSALRFDANVGRASTSVTITDAAYIYFSATATTTGTVTRRHGIYSETNTNASTNYHITLGSTDVDQNLIHIGNTEDALFWWDDSETAFAFDEGVSIGGILKQNVTGTSLVVAGGIAFTDVANAWIDDATHGAGTVTHYIGNETIDTTASDVRLKTNWSTPNGLSKEHLIILANSLEEYDYLPGNLGGQRFVGFGAQHLHKVLPQYVNVGEGDNNWSVNYKYMVGPLIKGWSEHEIRFSTVEDRVGALEEAQDILRAQVVALGGTPEN